MPELPKFRLPDMKWFKHENTLSNPKIRLLKRKHKAEGYAVYFQLLELISENVDKENIKEWGFLPDEYSKDHLFLSDELAIDTEKLEEILSTCYELDLLEDVDGRIYCGQILERCDRYTEQLQKKMEVTVHKNVENVHKLQKSTPRIEEEKNKKKNRKEKNITIGNASPKKFKATDAGVVSFPNRVSTKPQSEALTTAEYLKIDLNKACEEDETLRSRWFGLFKKAEINKTVGNIRKAQADLYDAPWFQVLQPHEKVKAFFWKFNNPNQEVAPHA
jgi:hypothetical protein